MVQQQQLRRAASCRPQTGTVLCVAAKFCYFIWSHGISYLFLSVQITLTAASRDVLTFCASKQNAHLLLALVVEPRLGGRIGSFCCTSEGASLLCPHSLPCGHLKTSNTSLLFFHTSYRRPPSMHSLPGYRDTKYVLRRDRCSVAFEVHRKPDISHGRTDAEALPIAHDYATDARSKNRSSP